MAKDIETKLNEVKSFMDNGAFVFKYSKSKAFAIHKNQLFKNQMYNYSTDVNGRELLTRKNLPEVKREKIKQITVNGILYDSGRVIAYNQYIDNYYEEINFTNVENENNNFVKDYGIKITSDPYNLYILTAMGKIYNRSLHDGHYFWGVEFNFERDLGCKVGYKNIFAGTYCENNINYYGLYILTSNDELYFYSKEYWYSDDKRNETKYLKSLGVYKNIKDIKSAYNRTFIIMENGEVYANGNDNYGTLGLGINIDNINRSGFNKVFSSFTQDIKDDQIFNISIKDVGIGKYHTIFLLTDGTAIGFGNNSYYQLGFENDVSIYNTIKRIQYPNSYFKEVKCTDYGTVFLTFDGKFIYTGTFVNGELALFNENKKIYELDKDGNENKNALISDIKTIMVDGESYTRFLQTAKPTKIAREKNANNTYEPIFYVKLYNEPSVSGVLVVKENGLIYYSGFNEGIICRRDLLNIPLREWTPIEDNTNNIKRIVDKNKEYWSYYTDLIYRNDILNKNEVVGIFYKTANGKWIDWMKYMEKCIDLSAIKNNIKTEYDVNNEELYSHINFDSYAAYIESHPSLESEYEINKRFIPEVDYIDENLNIWHINVGDNIACHLYTKTEIDRANLPITEVLSTRIALLNEYKERLNKTSDPENIEKYQTQIAIIESQIEEYEDAIKSNNSLIDKISTDDYLEFADSISFDSMKVVGKELKTVKYTHSKFTESGDFSYSEPVIVEKDGVSCIDKETTIKTVESNITKIKFELINYDRNSDPTVDDIPELRDDVKLSIQDDPNDDKEYSFDDLLIWMNGKFVNNDHYLDGNRKSFCIRDGLSQIGSRRICEYPDLGEPKQTDEMPKLSVDSATVIEPSVPTELRWDINLKAFGWENVKIDGPYQIHSMENDAMIDCELRKNRGFYFGEVYVQVFNQFKLRNRKCEKGTFILFMDGGIVTPDEYDVEIIENDTYITLKNFTEYIATILRENIDVTKPGYAGHVKQIVSSYENMSQFSIAFVSSKEKYKKIKLYYERQMIRNYPKPNQITFRKIKYNDLILFDGYYIPYLWDSLRTISIPDTFGTSKQAINSYIVHSDIYKLQPYHTYKREDEMGDIECKTFALETGLISDVQFEGFTTEHIRKNIVKPYIEAIIKEV